MSNYEKIIDPRFFEQPGFETMFEAWGEVFATDTNSNPILTAKEALSVTAQARNRVASEYGYHKQDPSLNELERISCRYAIEFASRFYDPITEAQNV